MMDGHGQPATHYTYSVETPHGVFKCSRRKPATAISLYRIKPGWGPEFRDGRKKPGDIVAVWHRMPLEKMKFGPAQSLCSFAAYIASYDLQGRELIITRTINTKVGFTPKRAKRDH